MLFGLSAVIGGENLDRNPSAKTKGIDEYLPLIDVGQLVVAVVEFLKDLLLLVRKLLQKRVVVVCNVAH